MLRYTCLSSVMVPSDISRWGIDPGEDARQRQEAGRRPEYRNSLGLLLSRPDPVGERSACFQLPAADYIRRGVHQKQLLIFYETRFRQDTGSKEFYYKAYLSLFFGVVFSISYGFLLRKSLRMLSL